MKTRFMIAAALLCAAPLPAADKPAAVLAPSEIVAAAPKADWVGIAPADLLVMDLAPDAKGKARRVVIQLMPAPFSQGWVGNVRKLAAAHWWDGLAVVRVQDNYVTQWGDPDGEDKLKARALPPGLVTVPQSEYEAPAPREITASGLPLVYQAQPGAASPTNWRGRAAFRGLTSWGYATFWRGWPIAGTMDPHSSYSWPIHCYGMVGVGRDMPPDTGTGAELYTVIGHAPRHLDFNIALVGRVIEGMEHLSSLPRGTGALGFYENRRERVKIRSVRLGNEVAGLAAYEYLSTESPSFAKYADARANRRDAFFIRPAGGADVCNIPVPVRRSTGLR